MHPRFRELLLPVRLQRLDPQANYEVKEIMLMPDEKSKISENVKAFTGDYLMKIGLPLLTSGDMTSRIIEITRE